MTVPVTPDVAPDNDAVSCTVLPTLTGLAGTETEVGIFDSTEHIQADFDQKVMFTTPGFTLTGVDLDPQGTDAKLSVLNLASQEGSSAATFTTSC